jgi:hypothetical protein
VLAVNTYEEQTRALDLGRFDGMTWSRAGLLQPAGGIEGRTCLYIFRNGGGGVGGRLN